MLKNSRRFLGAILAVLMVCACFMAGCKKKETEEEETVSVNLGAEQEIPWLELEGWTFKTANKIEWSFVQQGASDGKIYGTATENVVEANADIQNWDVGHGVYQNVYEKVSAVQYGELVDKLTAAGYKVYSEGTLNDGDVRYTLLTYQTYVYNLTYYANNAELYVTASAERPLSPHLLENNDSTQSEAVDGLDTKLTMLRWQEGGGDNYIIQLKNGHFILFDGGTHHMLAKALEFMEANTPAGQTPVVEAWFITHGHYDHVGWTLAYTGGFSDLDGLLTMGEAARRVAINGVYFNQTNDQIIEHTIYGWRSDGMRNKNKNDWPYTVDAAAAQMRTATGEVTPVYRPQAGQTYYFKDLTVEIPYCQEQIVFDDYQMDINASSTWYLVRAEDKVFLNAGDTENVNMEFVKNAYSENYAVFAGNVDIMSAFHHGHNIYSNLIDTFHAPIVFYTSKTMFSWASQYNQANKDMHANYDVTYYCYGEGAYQYNFTTGAVIELN